MGNNDDIKTRLREVLEAKKSNVSKITEGSNVKRSTLSAQINGNSAVSYDTINLFLRTFVDLSAEWLLKGIGNMFCGTSDVNKVVEDGRRSEPEAKEERRTSEDLLARENELLRQQVQFLKEQVEFYKNRK